MFEQLQLRGHFQNLSILGIKTSYSRVKFHIVSQYHQMTPADACHHGITIGLESSVVLQYV